MDSLTHRLIEVVGFLSLTFIWIAVILLMWSVWSYLRKGRWVVLILGVAYLSLSLKYPHVMLRNMVEKVDAPVPFGDTLRTLSLGLFMLSCVYYLPKWLRFVVKQAAKEISEKVDNK